MTAATRRGTLALRRAGFRYMKPRRIAKEPLMTRCIQIGTVTIQGRATEIRAGVGTIVSAFGPVRGRLTEIKREAGA